MRIFLVRVAVRFLCGITGGMSMAIIYYSAAGVVY